MVVVVVQLSCCESVDGVIRHHDDNFVIDRLSHFFRGMIIVAEALADKAEVNLTTSRSFLANSITSEEVMTLICLLMKTQSVICFHKCSQTFAFAKYLARVAIDQKPSACRERCDNSRFSSDIRKTPRHADLRPVRNITDSHRNSENQKMRVSAPSKRFQLVRNILRLVKSLLFKFETKKTFDLFRTDCGFITHDGLGHTECSDRPTGRASEHVFRDSRTKLFVPVNANKNVSTRFSKLLTKLENGRLKLTLLELCCFHDNCLSISPKALRISHFNRRDRFPSVETRIKNTL